MKNIINSIKILVLGIFASITFLSCGDEHDFNKYDSSVDANKAKLKFVHTGVGPGNTNFSVNFFANETKISAVGVLSGLPLGISYANTYPTPLNYSFIPAGLQDLRFSIPARAQVPATLTTPIIPAFPETPLFTAPVNTEAGKNYTTFLVGVAPDFSLHTVNDDFSNNSSNEPTAFVRFINLVNNTPAAGYELVISRTTPAPVTVLKTFSAIGFKGGSALFEPLQTIPATESTAYTIQFRVTGTTTILPTSPANLNFTPRPGRVYTFFSRGVVGATGAFAPTLSFYTNR